MKHLLPSLLLGMLIGGCATEKAPEVKPEPELEWFSEEVLGDE